MTNWWRDIRYGLRALANNKGFTAVAILALALGIGPNTAMFSVIWGIFLAPLPYHNPDQLVVVWTKVKGERSPSRADDYLQYVAQSKSFERLDLGPWKEIHMTGLDPSEEVVSGGYAVPGFYEKTLGVHLGMGRDFLPEEGVPGKDHEVIITHRMWTDHFHSDPNILGKQMQIENQPYTVVGVEKRGPSDRSTLEFTVPLALAPVGHNAMWGNIFGRLKPGVTIAQAQAELAVIDRRLAASRGGDLPADAWTVSVEPFKNDWFDKKLERNLWLLLSAVGFVLLIACANVANLLLARGAARQKEIAVRGALGASRGQVFAQLLTESLTLAILGGVIGIALGWAMMKFVLAMLPEVSSLTIEAEIGLNLPVLFFSMGVTLLAGILFGCAPAWQAAKLNLSETLKQGSQSMLGTGCIRLQGTLVVIETALALTLLSGAGMALHSFWKLTRIDIGVQTDHVLTAAVQMPKKDFADLEQIKSKARQLIEKLRALPGVENAALTTTIPLQGYSSFPFSIAGQPVSDAKRPVADFESVTPSYFGTLGVRLMKGRFLSDDDIRSSPQVVMVNETFASRYLPGMDPLTERLMLEPIVPNEKSGAATERQIVGVFHDVRNGEHLNDRTEPQILVPFWQTPWPNLGLVVKTAQDPGLISKSVISAVGEVLPGQPLTHVETMEEIFDTQVKGDRSGMVLFGGFAAIALLLAAFGIYGVMAFAVAQRRHEIGLRMALGAQREQVVKLILADGMKLALFGVGIGLLGAFTLGRLMRTTLYGIGTIDLASFSAVAFVLLAAAMIASYVPARRSAKVDPMIALRQE
jgi:putative ABC transport system permease protein